MRNSLQPFFTYAHFQGIKVFELFDQELQKLKSSAEAPNERFVQSIENEIECWINLLMDILIKDKNVDSSSDLIVKILEESEKSQYTKQIAIEKVCMRS